ncbi:MAG: efflux RND transporter periplasmic adaptor subunit [Mariniphaga sp.]
MTTNRIKKFRLSFTLLLIIFAVGMTYVSSKQTNQGSEVDQALIIKKKQFVCSMHPEVIKDNPGDCPICGMSLIEKIEQDKNSADSLLNSVVRHVNESVLGSVITVNPFNAKLPITIDALGIINYDPRKVRTVSARFGGVVERSFVKYQFQPVKKGQKIYEIYCPEIYAKQWNYVKLIQAYPDQDNLTVEAREWLSLLGLTVGQIDSLKLTIKPDYHLAVYSDAEGYAVSAGFDPEKYYSGDAQSIGNSLGFNDGVTIETGTQLFKIIDINSLRADLKVRTEDVWLLEKGQKVIFTVAASPGKKFEAAISQIEPLNGGLFQLVKVYFTDLGGHLLPGSQIQAKLQAGNHEALWLSRTAVVNLGQRQSAFVMQDNKYVATTIKTGLRSDDNVEILSGVDQNSKIALNGLLLIDSDGFINTGSE